MYTYTDLCLAHPLESYTPFAIVVNSAYALLTTPVTWIFSNISPPNPSILSSGTGVCNLYFKVDKSGSLFASFVRSNFYQKSCFPVSAFCGFTLAVAEMTFARVRSSFWIVFLSAITAVIVLKAKSLQLLAIGHWILHRSRFRLSTDVFLGA